MAHTGIINLADRLLNQSQAQTEESSPAPPQKLQARASSASASDPPNADQFTSSNVNQTADASAQAAGLFSVGTLSLFTAAANFILGTTKTPTANGNSGGPTPQNSSLTASTTPATAGAASSASATVATAASTSAAAVTSPPDTPDTDTTATGTAGAPITPSVEASTFIPPPTLTQVANANSQLQSLNDSLAALGLSATDISVVDRLASVLQDYNPTAYTSLVYQLRGLAENPASPTPAATSANAASATNALTSSIPTVTAASGSATNPSAAAPIAENTPVNNVPKGSAGATAFQVRELLLRFGGTGVIPATSQAAGSSAANPATTPSSPGLQFPELRLTLNSSNGQSATLIAPQPAEPHTNENSSDLQPTPEPGLARFATV